MIKIALTKKLATVAKQEFSGGDQNIDPLFVWTANWTNTFQNRKEDLLVIVNKATRFTVLIYGMKKAHFTKFEDTIRNAIKHTIQKLYINPVLIEKYCENLSNITFVKNTDRQQTTIINRVGLDSAITVANAYNNSQGKMKFNDSIGGSVSKWNFHIDKELDSNFPSDYLFKNKLSKYYNEPVYKYKAFELEISLDLDIYKAIRRVIVPTNLPLNLFHNVLQKLYSWDNTHLYQFTVYNSEDKRLVDIVSDIEGLAGDEKDVLADQCTLDQYFPNNKMVYTYDFGDNWEHEIKFIQEIQDCDKEPPYLVSAEGQAPPENVGGVDRFVEFYKILQNPKHPQYIEMKEWAGYWRPELNIHSIKCQLKHL